MALPSQVLAIEASYIGVAETPDGSNITPFSDWYGMHAAWCAMFQSYCLAQAGVPIGPGPKGAAWCSAFYQWHADQGRGWVGVSGIRAGDLIFFEWGSTPGGFDHIGMVEVVNTDGTVTTIEGNTRNRVQRLRRSLTTDGIAAHARPLYSIPTQENDVGALTGVQGQQFDALVERIERIDFQLTNGDPEARSIRIPIGETNRKVKGLAADNDDDAGAIADAIIDGLPKALAKQVADELAHRLAG